MKAIGIILAIIIVFIIEAPAYVILPLNLNKTTNTVFGAICYIYLLFIIAFVAIYFADKFYNWFVSKLK